MQKWVVGGVPRVVLVSSRALEAGEHCTYNYHADTMDGLVKRQVCLCGSPNCSGFIGGKVTQTTDNEWASQAEKTLNQAKPKIEALRALDQKARELGVPIGSPELVQIRSTHWYVAFPSTETRAALPQMEPTSLSRIPSWPPFQKQRR